MGPGLDEGNEAVVFRQELAVREYGLPLPGLTVGGRGIRVAHISDFHFRRWNTVLDQARWRLMVHDYDLLVVTGDFSSLSRKWRHAAGMCRRFFDGVSPRLGIYAVLGNHDRPRLANQTGLPFRWLHDEHVRLDAGGGSLFLAGVNQCEAEFGNVTAALAGIPDGAAVLLLAHYPSTAFDLAPGRVQLMLSGHTHGGQIRLPGLGCVFTNDRIPTRAARGLHRIGGTMVHVSAGIGTSGSLPFRWRCPPEVSMITLRKARKDPIRAKERQSQVRNSVAAMELAIQV